MSIDDAPTGDTGGQSGVPGPTMPALPEKLRVHALARLVGRTSKQVLSTLSEIGQEVRSVQSSVSRATAEQVIAALAPPEGAPGVGEQPATPAAAAAPEEPEASEPTASEPAASV
ncbi:MAG: translation initiation factor IF-2 N-terminal domain-containing protein, partial [Actinomycetota bacterium]|nr:translation initiation factor IF-2 N-terminal domain-containing protein [Actinomycetota bacterium]